MEDQQSTSDYDPESGLSLKDAIRQFSDPDLWFEYQTFSAPTTSLRVLISVRAQALLKNESSKSRAIKKSRKWKKLRDRFEARLHSEELAVVGYVEPVALDGEPVLIPCDKLRLLSFDYKASTASAGAGLTVIGIRVFPRADVPARESSKTKRSVEQGKGARPDTQARRGGRKKGSGSLAGKDARLVEVMKPLVADGKSAWAAAMEVVDVADGSGTVESKAKRLVARFKEWQKSNSV